MSSLGAHVGGTFFVLYGSFISTDVRSGAVNSSSKFEKVLVRKYLNALDNCQCVLSRHLLCTSVQTDALKNSSQHEYALPPPF